MRYRDFRYPCDTEITVIHGERALRARLVNISSTGARITGLGRLPRDTRLTLTYLNARFVARLVWSDDRQAGLRFALPLSTQDMNALRREGGRQGGGWRPPTHHGFRELA